MQVRYIVAVLAVMLLAGFVTVRAQEGEKPRKEKTPAAKIVKPWSDLKDLSDEQQGKIKEIHAKALEEMKAIRQKETADIMALLTDAQKEELKSIQEKERAAKKATKKEEPTS